MANLKELHSQIPSLELRRAFMRLPLEERQRRLALQAAQMIAHYKRAAEQAEREEWQGGVLSNNSTVTPKRGEIWLVNLDPTIGAEIKKVRPAVVVSSDAIGRLPIKLVAPLTDWKNYFASNMWLVRVDPTSSNGLAKVSAVDTLQMRGLDQRRFIRKLGDVLPDTINEIILAIAAVIEYP